MNNISQLISHLVQSAYLRPESGTILRAIFPKMALTWDISHTDVDALLLEMVKCDTSSVILHEENLRGKFLELAPNLAASLVLEQTRSNRPDYQQSQRVYSLYMKLCEMYHFDRGCC